MSHVLQPSKKHLARARYHTICLPLSLIDKRNSLLVIHQIVKQAYFGAVAEVNRNQNAAKTKIQKGNGTALRLVG